MREIRAYLDADQARHVYERLTTDAGSNLLRPSEYARIRELRDVVEHNVRRQDVLEQPSTPPVFQST
jgi:hypothetical protein